VSDPVWEPEGYPAVVRREVPDYERLQDEAAAATGTDARRVLERDTAGPFDVVVSALAIHHLDGPGKADLFRRAAAALAPAGRLVVADVVVPESPADVVTPLEPGLDKPSTVAEQLRWLTAAGLRPSVAWARRDLAVLAATR